MSLRSSGVSAVKSHTKVLEVIGNNVGNMNSHGFKASKAMLQEGFTTVLRYSSPSDDSKAEGSNTTAQVIGNGVQIGATCTDFGQGGTEATGRQEDFEIQGDGFFEVRDSLSGKSYATRKGNFRTDDRGYLCTQNGGFRVQGLKFDENQYLPAYEVDWDAANNKPVFTEIIPNPAAATPTAAGDMKVIKTVFEAGSTKASTTANINGGELKLTPALETEITNGTLTAANVIAQAPTITSWNVTEEGKITYTLSDNKTFSTDTVCLINFRDNQALVNKGGGLYSSFDAAGVTPIQEGISEPGANGLGKIQTGSLETSNVDLTNELSSIIAIQQGLQSGARILALDSEISKEIVNIGR